MRKIIADLDKKLNTIFTPASLAASRSISSMQVREINSVNTAATSANDDFLLALLANPQVLDVGGHLFLSVSDCFSKRW